MELRVVCPVYNEAASCLDGVVAEWEPVLDGCLKDWEWVFIDDGSTRAETREALKRIEIAHPRFKTRRIPNGGHGQACVFGYRQYRQDSRWLLQVDSDGQCRASDFPSLWKARQEGFHQCGVRRGREDGFERKIFSLGVRLYLRLVTGVSHPDPNCPYRLLWCAALEPDLRDLPYSLANIALALRTLPRSRFTAVGFRRRSQGRSTHRLGSSLKALLELRGCLKT